MTLKVSSDYDKLMDAKARALANKFLINILIVLLFVNGGLGFMLTLNIRSDAKLWLAALLIFIDVTVLLFAAIRDRKIRRYFKLPHRKAKVVVSGHSNFMFGGQMAWQTAVIKYQEDDGSLGASPLRLEIGSSTISFPSFVDAFEAQVYLDQKEPKLLVNLELGILLTVTGVFDEFEDFGELEKFKSN